MPEVQRPLWTVDLVSKINALAEECQLDDESTDRFREFVVSVAKSNYVAGNSAGIYWARTGKVRANQLLSE